MQACFDQPAMIKTQDHQTHAYCGKYASLLMFTDCTHQALDPVSSLPPLLSVVHTAGYNEQAEGLSVYAMHSFPTPSGPSQNAKVSRTRLLVHALIFDPSLRCWGVIEPAGLSIKFSNVNGKDLRAKPLHRYCASLSSPELSEQMPATTLR